MSLNNNKSSEEILENFNKAIDDQWRNHEGHISIKTVAKEELKKALTLKDQVHKAEVEEAVREERGRIDKILISMSWQQRNETPEAIRVLHEIRESLTTLLPESDKQK